MGFSSRRGMLSLYSSSTEGDDPRVYRDAVQRFKHHFGFVMPVAKWTQVKRDVVCAKHDLVADSGIAVISNALAVIFGNQLEKGMGEIACWKRRETFAQQCLDSGIYVSARSYGGELC